MNDISSAYIHIPFCKSKCPYCDFISYAGVEDRTTDYLVALCKEIELTSLLTDTIEHDERVATAGLQTVYIGGGTPSLLSAGQIKRIIESLSRAFPISSGAEITVEVNPGTVNSDLIKGYVDAGINRISIGIQSFSDKLLQLLGRIHTREQGISAIDYSKEAGLSNISCDLMIGLPGQSTIDAMDSLDILIEKEIPHISIYSLSLEDGTPFQKKYSRSIDDLAPPEIEREMYQSLIQRLKERGYCHYEISNLSLPGFESRHNTTYWKARPYFGFGCAAHSYRGGSRIENTSDLNRYISVLCGRNPSLQDIIEDKVEIDASEEQKEFMLLGLRLLQGVSGDEYEKRFGKCMDESFGTVLEKHLITGLLERCKNQIRLSRTGIDFANIVFRDFV
jgi:oxygen-independent coproporphyrinogen-3 oxidase